MTTPEKLRAYIYVNADVAATAEHVAALIERDYHCAASSFHVSVSNLEMGEIAKALRLHTSFSETNHRYYLMIEHERNTVLLEGPITFCGLPFVRASRHKS